MSEAPRKKILMLTTQLGYGGAETSFIRLANYLSETMDVTVALFTRDYGAGSYAAGHIPLTPPVLLLDNAIPAHRLRRWWQRIRQLRALKLQHDACISFLSGPNLVNVLAGINRRSIVSVRGSRHYDPVATPRARRLFQYLLDPMIFRLAARIVPVSAGLMHEIQAAAGAASLKRTRVISPFIDMDSITERLAEPPPEYFAVLRGQKVIVAAGRLSVEKGFQHLIRVFSSLAKSENGVKLLLIGDGPMLQQLRAQCTELSLAIDDVNPNVSAVIFAGYQANPLPLMALGHVYVLSSATEGFPNVLLEAMAAGATLLAADTPWGARAVLGGNPHTATQPYPTSQPTPTDYGILMPRIDLPHHTSAWVEALRAALAAPRGQAASHERLQHFSLPVVGAKWHALLAEMEVGT